MNAAARKRRREAEFQAGRKRIRKEEQDALRAKYNIPNTDARFWIVKPKGGPKKKPRLSKTEIEAMQAQLDSGELELEIVTNTSARGHTLVPNPNHVTGSNTPRFAAIVIHGAVKDAHATLSDLVQAFEDVSNSQWLPHQQANRCRRSPRSCTRLHTASYSGSHGSASGESTAQPRPWLLAVAQTRTASSTHPEP